ncbi:hypothetical protein [Paenibacillus sp. PL2-23]|uniref:hypothetical protein n=1 Tax=Paenibacillus sp. PL2-23 TaxID=2100729 RepID=UPI0030F62EF0
MRKEICTGIALCGMIGLFHRMKADEDLISTTISNDKRRLRMASLMGLLLLLIAAMVIPGLAGSGDRLAPKASKGVLDLRDWSLQEDGPVRLNGEWDLYWERLAGGSPEESLGEPVTIEVPGEWETIGLPGRGYATYKLQVLTRGHDGAFGLQIPAIAPAYKVLVDGREVAGAGIVGPSREETRSAYNPQTVTFVPQADEFELLIEVSNVIYPEGGI